MCCLLCVPVWAQSSGDDVADEPLFEIEIPASNAAEALNRLAEQTGAILLFPYDLAESRQTNAVAGQYTLMKALSELLKDSGLSGGLSDRRVIQIAADDASTTTIDDTSKSGENAMNATKKAGLFAIIAGALSGGVDAQEPTDDEAAQTEERPALPTISQQRDSEEIRRNEEIAKGKRGLAEFVVFDEIIVRGKNVGVRRFEDDPQPYIIFNSDDIDTSLATNLEDFLRTRLPQNTQPGSTRQFQNNSAPGNTSTIDLRGLGQEETLILVNGRRAPRINIGNDFRQADINGIPLGSIERIEVLPSTASGIYGGGATGGVINIITRRNFVGGEVLLEYGNTFDTDVGERRVTGSFGFPLEGGKTSVQISASYADSNELLVGDRPFAQASRDLLLRNVPVSESFPRGPVGALPNITSRTGGNLILDDGTDLGGAFTFIPAGYAGIASDGAQALIDNAGQYSLDLPNGIAGNAARLVQAPTQESVSVVINREFASNFDVYLDASLFRNEGQSQSSVLPEFVDFFSADDPGNPFDVPVRITTPNFAPPFPSSNSSETVQVVLGANWDFAPDWTASFDYIWSRSTFESEQSGLVFNNSSFTDPDGTDPDRVGFTGAARNGSLDLFRDIGAFPLDLSRFAYSPLPTVIDFPRENELSNLALRVSGSAFELPAGSVNVSLLAETRQSELKGSFRETTVSDSPSPGTREIVYTPPREQSVDSLYAEALVPVFSDRSDIPLMHSLDLQISARYDAYETITPGAIASATLDSIADPLPDFDEVKTNFDSIDYTLGLRYQPVEDVVLRASFATGFVPPSVTQLFPRIRQNGFAFGADPRRPGTLPFYFVDEIADFGNPDLRPEESESWSAGFILTPRQIPGFRFSADYTLIDKVDEIATVSLGELFELEDSFPERIVRAPLTPDEEAAGFTGGVIEFLDLSPLNLASSKSESIDFQVDQYLEFEGIGEFRLYGIATFMDRVETQILADSEVRPRVGFDDGPLEWRGNVGLTWTNEADSLSVGWNAQFYDEYLVYSSTASDARIEDEIEQHGRDTIPSQVFHDLTLMYRPDISSGRFASLLEGTELRLGIQNVFDEEPFIRPSRRTTGEYSAYGDVRMRRYSILIRKSF